MHMRTHQPRGTGPGPAKRRDSARGRTDFGSPSPADQAGRNTEAEFGLQRSIGNRAVASLIQRESPQLIVEHLRKNEIAGYAKMSRRERLAKIAEIAGPGTTWVGPNDETTLERLWESFGAALPEVAAENVALWKTCIDRGAALNDLKPMRALREQFGDDVKKATRRYLAVNAQLLEQERVRLGLRRPPGKSSRAADLARDAATEELQDLSGQATEVVAAEEMMREKIIAREEVYERVDETSFRALSGYRDVRFDPRRPHPSPGWTEAKEHWDQLQGLRMAIGRRSPGVFALMEHGGGADLATVADASPDEARAAIGTSLDRVDGKISQTAQALATDDLDWHDLTVVHRQLFDGKARPGSVDWSSEIPKSVGKDVTSDHEDREWWIDLGLGTLAAAAFVFSELATAGWATVLWAGVGVGIGAGQAVSSWENWDDLATAADASANPDTRVVTHEQADAAMTTAVLDSVFAFLDVGGVAGGVYRAARTLGAASAARTAGRAAGDLATSSLKRIDRLDPPAARVAVERAVEELGAAEAVRRSGKAAYELAELVGRDTDVGKRLLLQGGRADLPDLVHVILGLPTAKERRAASMQAMKALDTLPADQVERVVAEAVDELGPAAAIRAADGWKTLAQRLGNQSPTAQRLDTWRDGIELDLLAEFGEDRVVRTGRRGQMSNDFDVSTLGPTAQADRQRVRAFLASRVGVGPDDLGPMLHCEVFTDPRRMHLASLTGLGLDADVAARLIKEQTVRQEQLVQNRRLLAALDAGDDVTATALRESMAEMGIKEIPDFRILSEGEIGRVGQAVDALHAELIAASQTGDSARVATLVDEIADRQALINASEGGGYFTGGGTRRYVSERDRLPGFDTPVESGLRSAPELYAGMIDQLPKLDDAVAALRRALAEQGSEDGLASALKALGKYGERLSESMGDLLFHHGGDTAGNLVDSLQFNRLAKECSDLKLDIERGAMRGVEENSDAARELLERGTTLIDDVTTRSRQVREAALEASGTATTVSDFDIVQKAVRNDLLVERVAAVAKGGLNWLMQMGGIALKKELGETAAPELDAPPGE